MTNTNQNNFLTRLVRFVAELVGGLFVSNSSRDFQRLKDFIAS
jgi:hypothetical protein